MQEVTERLERLSPWRLAREIERLELERRRYPGLSHRTSVMLAKEVETRRVVQGMEDQAKLTRLIWSLTAFMFLLTVGCAAVVWLLNDGIDMLSGFVALR